VFASALDRPPGRMRRGARTAGRSLIHEYVVVVAVALLLAVAWTWPTLRYPLHTLPQDLGDPARQAWQAAWSGHILLIDPARLWQSNAYFPQRYAFAFGDSLLGYAPAGLLGEGPLAATLRYNVLFVLAHALLLIGGYALVRQLGAGRTGAAVAAVAFAYAPTGCDPSAGTPAGPRPGGWWPHGRSRWVSRWDCRSRTFWAPPP
jgi:hypothetical protein